MNDDRQCTFLQTELLAKILSQNSDLKGSEVIKCVIETPAALDGFMGTIYSLDVTIKKPGSEQTTSLNLLVKVMKGSETFRRESLGLVLFPNEINVYKNVIPAFKELITRKNASIDFETWCPRIYYSEQGDFPTYSDQFETMLAMQNAQPLGYTSGPRLDLDDAHLRLMARKIAQFHACSYALRITQNDQLSQLVNDIIPLNFIQDGKIIFESYDVVFRSTQERMYSYFDNHPELLTDDNVRADIRMLQKKYGTDPSHLMQRCLQRDNVYSVILHGDYNRNNVLFKYKNGKPVDMLMIDFQENRFGSPALDLSFFMYMNITTEMRENCWNEILQCYHNELLRGIREITGIPANDTRLEPYSFDSLMAHLSTYFIYGAIIAVKFLPVMMATTEEVALITHFFHNDIHAEGFRAIAKSCGGDAVNQRVAALMVHCSKKGYLKFLWE